MPTSTSMRIPTSLLIGTGAVVFFANAGLLVLQLVAGKLLAPFIGSSIETWTSVIGVFLTGIALGNWLGGRIADRFPSPRTVGVLLILGGLSAFGMVLCYNFTLDSGFYRSIPLTPRIPILALMFCLVPALLFSLLTPLTIKLILPDIGAAGRIAGLVFALSTFGCLVGNYFTGFWLMAYLTLNQITMGVGIGLIILAVPVFFMKRPRVAADLKEWQLGLGRRAGEPAAGGWDFTRDIRLAYAIVFVASFCGMSLELTGSRVLAPLVGVSLYTWTGIIGVMLAGTTAGNYLGGVLADRGVAAALRRFAAILGVLVGAAVGPICARELIDGYNPKETEKIDWVMRFAGAAVGLLALLPGLLLSKFRGGRYLLTAILGGLLGTALSHTTGRAIDRAILLSKAFTQFHRILSQRLHFDVAPLLIHGLGFIAGAGIALLFVWDAPKKGEGITRSSALSGSLFLGGVMTLAILLLLGVFSHTAFMYPYDIVEKVLAWTFGVFFLPMLFLGAISPQVIRLSVPDVKSAGRVAGSVYALSTTGAIVGTFTTGYFLISALGTFRVLMILAFTLTVLAFLVGRLWKNNVMLYAASITCGGAIFGLYLVDFGSNRYDLETKYYAIKVTKTEDGDERDLTLDHLLHSSVRLSDPTWFYYKHEYIQCELLMAVLSRHAHPNVLVIGGGGYTFPRYVECLMPDVQIDVVEIDPGVTEIAHREFGLPRNTKIRTFNMDGRQFVSEKAPKAHYQLVTQDAVNDLSVPGHLMTKEYNDAVKATLTPDGAYLLTLIDSLRDGLLWRAAMHTMRESFKYVYVLTPYPMENSVGEVSAARTVCVLFGSDRPFDLDSVRAAADRFQENRLRRDSDAVALLAPQAPYAVESLSPWLEFYTHALRDQTLNTILREIKKDDGSIKKFDEIILRDQYCPVDNLMTEVFREQARDRTR